MFAAGLAALQRPKAGARFLELTATAAAASGGESRTGSHCRFAPPLIHFIPYSLTYSVPLFMKRQCGRILGEWPCFGGTARAARRAWTSRACRAVYASYSCSVISV
jgi:hypothetical protein